ncbi:ATP-binding protein [Geminicoccus flavidas]|uniref:ATP-binding protein n=1 Tax=Geminicoccus flavidas TaxID=2506407 RepID=UPI00135A3007|nr:AAA family ATPase [Geminicoccus flavidas]
MDVGVWLHGLGLGQYEQAFRDNNIDADLLVRLTAEDLKEIGVASVGHRRRLLGAIAGLSEAAATGQATQVLADAPAECRQLTVMFVDLEGSTELSQCLDPEEMREVIRAYQEVVQNEVVRLAGYVAKYMGDGVLVYFGWPQAFEDAAERAVRAGLAVVTAVAQLQGGGEALACRVGIATGLVVVGDLVGSAEARERMVVGETPNLAARLQELAEVGQVLIAERTHAILGDLFSYRDLGLSQIKGFAQPVRVYGIAGEADAASRFQARHPQGATALVGREAELALLRERWDLAQAGEGQVVLVSGEPGIGKSRLVLALCEQVVAQPCRSFRYQCSPHHTNSALWPVIDQLQRSTDVTREDAPENSLARLQAHLAAGLDDPASVAELFAELLGLPAAAAPSLADLTPEQKKARIFQALLAWIEQAAREQPVLLVLEDSHWIDPTTLELFDLLVGQMVGCRALLVITCRPEFKVPWLGRAHVALLPLGNLSRRHVAAIISHVAVDRKLAPEVVEQIIAKTDGVPLFVEELTKTVLELGLTGPAGAGGPPPALAIPTTLHDSLLARLDRLAPVKEVAQIGAVIGREFTFDLLAAVAGRPPDMLRLALAELVKAELIFSQGLPPAARYIFKHALVQDAAYRSLLRSRRRQLHAQIARALEQRFPEVVDTQPELLAHHFTQAGLVEEAIAYWQKAGERAIARSAGTEAKVHLTQALILLNQLPDGPERQRREFDLQVALGSVISSLKGYGSTEAEQVWERTSELCYALGMEQPARMLLAQGAVHCIRGQYRRACATGKELLRQGTDRNDPQAILIGHRSVGVNEFHLGELQSARHHLEQILALYEQGLSSIFGFFADARVVSLSYLSLALLVSGHPDQARTRVREGLYNAQELSHPGSVAYVRAYCFAVAQFCGDVAGASAEAEAYKAITQEQGFPMMHGESLVYCGWALAENGQPAAGIATIREGLASLLATRTRIFMPYNRALLVEAYERGGWPKAEQLRQLNKALRQTERNEERWLEAELYRRRGVLLASGPDADPIAAEADIRHALALARAQGAKLWELRAVCSLWRVAGSADIRREARNLLAPLYQSFTEGFDIRDLQEARTLLDQQR